MNAVQPIRDKEKIQEILRFLKEWNYKYYLMFLMGIRSGLRISDILKLKVKDVREANGKIRTHLVTKEKKTSKRKRIKLHSEIKKALAEYTVNKDDEAYIHKSDFNLISNILKATSILIGTSCFIIRFNYF